MSKMARGARIVGPLVLFLALYYVVRFSTSKENPQEPAAETSEAKPASSDARSVEAPTVQREPALPRPQPLLVHFTVKDAKTSSPLELAEIAFLERTDARELTAAFATTDRSGRADLTIHSAQSDAGAAKRFEPWLRSGKSVLLVRAARHAWFVERASPFAESNAPTEATTRVVELSPGLELRGIVKDSMDSAPVEGATIFVGGGNGVGDVYTEYDSFPNATAADGVFEIALVEGKAASLTQDAEFEVYAFTKSGVAHTTVPYAEVLDASLTIERMQLFIDVVDEGDHPILGATAKATPARGYGELSDAVTKGRIPFEIERDFLFRKAGKAGRIEFESLPALTRARRYSVTVAADGYEMTTLDARFEAEEQSKTPTLTLKAVMKPPSGITIHGFVRDRRGQPIEGAVIESRQSNLPRVTTDASGAYRIEGGALNDRSWSPVITKEGYVESKREFDLSNKGNDVAQDLTLWKIAPIHGTVVDTTGAPVPGVQVELQLTEDAPIPHSAKSDAAGRFAFEPGGEGTWTIFAMDFDAVGDSSPNYFYAPFRGLVEGGTSDYVVVLERIECGASIDIEVVHGKNDEPVAVDGAFATPIREWVSGEISYGTSAKIDGSHVRCEGVPAGRYKVAVIAGKEFGAIDVDVPNGSANVKATLSIGGLGSIEGRVLGGGPRAKWKIWLMAGAGTSIPNDGPWKRLAVPGTVGILGETLSRDDGSFVLIDVFEGAYRVWAIGLDEQRGLSAITDVIVRRNAATHVEVVAAKPAYVAFTSADVPEGVRFALLVRGRDGSTQNVTTIGTYDTVQRRFNPGFQLAPGEYTWSVDATTKVSGGQSVTWRPRLEGSFTLAAGERKAIALEFPER